MACKGVDVAATEHDTVSRRRRSVSRQLAGRLARRLARLLGGVFAVGIPAVTGTLAPTPAAAAELPENRAEAAYHVYRGGGVTAGGPALLVRKSLADRVSLSANYYVDMVSNASIDVVTTASPFKETRNAYELGADWLVRDSVVSLSLSNSREPDYVASAVGVDVSTDLYGGMSTVTLGFSRANDQVGQRDRGFFDTARHWQYRAGLTQVLSPRWLASLNFEAVSDDGYLGSPYRAARAFGTLVPERNPRTRTSRAVKLGSSYALDGGSQDRRHAIKAEYRYFWDTWQIQAHTAQVAYTRAFGNRWIADAQVRAYSQKAALFYSDNATSDTLYLSRSRQLSTFTNLSVGGKLSWRYGKVADHFDVSVTTSYELMNLNFKDYTDLRTGNPYAYRAHVVQAFVSANF
jgi:hypothetical protein